MPPTEPREAAALVVVAAAAEPVVVLLLPPLDWEAAEADRMRPPKGPVLGDWLELCLSAADLNMASVLSALALTAPTMPALQWLPMVWEQ